MEMEDVLLVAWVALIIALLTFILGLFCGQPAELENGCIVHKNKVYCEEVNKVED